MTARVMARLRTVDRTVWLCAVPIALLAIAGWHRRWVTDDAFIDLRVVDNIAHGHGPVFNPGERVEAYTSPLWVAILWLLRSILPGVSLEWIAVVCGLACAVLGMIAAARGAWLLWRSAGRTGLGLPLGLLVVAGIAAMWDYTTSGLESGLVFAWLGVTFWVLARVLLDDAPPRPSGWRRALPRASPGWAAALIGCGVLVRPDLLVFSAAFLAALLAARLGRGRRTLLRLVLLAALLPVAYEIFRMGYFAVLEPNTALAKEAGSAEWVRGLRYLKDFVAPYVLFVPVLALAGLVLFELRSGPRPPRRAMLLGGAPLVGALLHVIFIVRVGGDFMHGRMLLPTLFGAVLPFAVVIPVVRGLRLAVGLAVVPWAILSVALLRPSYGDPLKPAAIDDERAFWVALSRNDHPVTLGDYRRTLVEQAGAALRRLAAAGSPGVVDLPPGAGVKPIDGGLRARVSPLVVADAGAIGIVGYAAGPQVRIVDQLGLADPLGSRTRIEALRLPTGVKPARVRAGHDKLLVREWLAARFGRHAVLGGPGPPLSGVRVAAARRALACGSVKSLLTAVDGPLTIDRFFSNMRASFRLDRMRFSPDPVKAARELCNPD
jgi:arabinofuranosyltransferase